MFSSSKKESKDSPLIRLERIKNDLLTIGKISFFEFSINSVKEGKPSNPSHIAMFGQRPEVIINDDMKEIGKLDSSIRFLEKFIDEYEGKKSQDDFKRFVRDYHERSGYPSAEKMTADRIQERTDSLKELNSSVRQVGEHYNQYLHSLVGSEFPPAEVKGVMQKIINTEGKGVVSSPELERLEKRHAALYEEVVASSRYRHDH